MLNGYKTYLGILMSIAPTVAHMLGYTLTPSFAEQFPELVDAGITLAGALLAFYGRAVASSKGWIAK